MNFHGKAMVKFWGGHQLVLIREWGCKAEASVVQLQARSY